MSASPEDPYDPNEGTGLIAFGCGCVCTIVWILCMRAVCG
jgi:hypothetical protein